MARPRPCLGTGGPCPARALTRNPSGRCDQCQPGWNATHTYGRDHKALRRRYEPIVKAGEATCWRCRRPIAPGDSWDLGHDDDDRTRYRGPEHAACNRATAGR